jgi:hypothetical protein
LVGFLVEVVVGQALFLFAYFLSIASATLMFSMTRRACPRMAHRARSPA